MKKFLKSVFQKLLFSFYKILIKNKIKDKKTIPTDFVNDIYEIFTIKENNSKRNKIIIPYVEVNNFNRHDLDRPFEILEIEPLQYQNKYTIKLVPTKNFILPKQGGNLLISFVVLIPEPIPRFVKISGFLFTDVISF